MALQFRSRSVNQETPIKIIGDINTGWCCGFGAGFSKAKCMAVGGRFLPGAINSANCNSSSTICGGLPALTPGACCYWEETDGLYTQTCTITENRAACVQLNKGAAEGLGYSFYPDEMCVADGGNIACNPVKPVADDVLRNCNPNSVENCYDVKNIYGNCCTNITQKFPDCSISTKEECGMGMWFQPKNKSIQSCIKRSPCLGIRKPGINGALSPASISTESLKNISNFIQSEPEIGSSYQGGVYIGIFSPGIPINPVGSVVYGNEICGPIPSHYVARGIGSGTRQAKSWILIADDSDYGEYSYNLTTEQQAKDLDTSVFDGVHNTYKTESEYTNNLLNTVRKYSKNGFNDWYIPSQDELAFYFKNIPYGYKNDNFYPLNYTQYLTSTTYISQQKQDFFGSSFIISQLNTENDYGKVAIVSKTKKIGLRLFRRILIDPIPEKNTFMGPVGSEDIPPIMGISLETENCTVCLLSAAEIYNDRIKALKKQYEDTARRINEGIDPFGRVVPCPGSKRCCSVHTDPKVVEECIKNLDKILNDMKKQIYGDPSCRMTFYDYCDLDKCPRSVCVGDLGAIKDQYIESVTLCCVDPCEKEQREQGKKKPLICSNKYPGSPQYNSEEIGNEVLWPMGKDEEQIVLEEIDDRRADAQYLTGKINRDGRLSETSSPRYFPNPIPTPFNFYDYDDVNDCVDAAVSAGQKDLKNLNDSYAFKLQELFARLENCVNSGRGYDYCNEIFETEKANLDADFERKENEIHKKMVDRVALCNGTVIA